MRLRAIGAWLELNGQSIYGTTKTNAAPTQATVSTGHGDVQYLHVLDYVSDCVTIRDSTGSITQARLLRDGTPREIERHGRAITFTIPLEGHDPFDTVVALS